MSRVKMALIGVITGHTYQEAQGLQGVEALIGVVAGHEQAQHDAHDLGSHDNRCLAALWCFCQGLHLNVSTH